ncbi:cysteine--tRNA ligase, partial [bacterium]|nr:cysteine--tRNA ligase [bacterium]
RWMAVLGLQAKSPEPALSDEVESVLKARWAARQARDFGEADRLRVLLLTTYGIIVEDGKDGYRWKRATS